MSLQAICTKQELKAGWQWKQRCPELPLLTDVSADHSDRSDPYQWRSADTVPSEIHVELLKAGLIPDPYIGFNEHRVQCNAYLSLLSAAKQVVHRGWRE
jgi:hypothetical protein